MWGRRNAEHTSRLEGALRSRRAEPSADFVDGVAEHVAGRPRVARPWSRVAFALALTVLIFGTFASFGGLSYAASGGAGTYKAVHRAVVKHRLLVSVHTSSAAGQYPQGVLKPPAAGVKPVKHVRKHHVATAPTQAVSAQTLPFTGISLLGTFLASLGLIGAGIFLRRRESRN